MDRANQSWNWESECFFVAKKPSGSIPRDVFRHVFCPLLILIVDCIGRDSLMGSCSDKRRISSYFSTHDLSASSIKQDPEEREIVMCCCCAFDSPSFLFDESISRVFFACPLILNSEQGCNSEIRQQAHRTIWAIINVSRQITLKNLIASNRFICRFLSMQCISSSMMAAVVELIKELWWFFFFIYHIHIRIDYCNYYFLNLHIVKCNWIVRNVQLHVWR